MKVCKKCNANLIQGENMAVYSCSISGLKIILKPKSRTIVNGQVNITPGKAIKFNDGRYATEDPEEIRFLDAYSSRNPSEMNRIDQSIEAVEKIRKVFQEEPITITDQKISQKPKIKK